MIISFCGHAKFYATKEVRERLLSLLGDLAEDENVIFYLGDHGSFDAFGYSVCKEYKENHSKARLCFVTPYITEQYQKKILPMQEERYDEIIYPDIEDKPLRFAISYRNKWMVENADVLICYIDHDWGGAYQAYLHAKRRKKIIYNLSGMNF